MVANKTRSKKRRGGGNTNNNNTINDNNFFTAKSGENNQARNFENIDIPKFPNKEEKIQTNTRKMNKQNIVKNFNSGIKMIRNIISESMSAQKTIQENQKQNNPIWTTEGQDLLLKKLREQQLQAQQQYEVLKKLKSNSLRLINQGKMKEYEELVKKYVEDMKAYDKQSIQFEKDFKDIYSKHMKPWF